MLKRLVPIFILLSSIALTAPGASRADERHEYVLVGAGDIASCHRFQDEATADILDKVPGTVFTLGDNVYYAGSLAEFAACYDSSWGRHKARTRPAAGNHDYLTPEGLGYFGYFGEAAAPPNGYYSYDLGNWHVVVLNTNCFDVPGGCGPESPQMQWLEADLAAHPGGCTLAYTHYPLFTSGAKKPGYPFVKPFWEVLYDAGAELIMGGDDHVYERFAPQTPDGKLDRSNGIRHFTVGTGGFDPYIFKAPLPNSEVRSPPRTHGVLKLTLRADSYGWQFLPIAGQAFTDSGKAGCH